MSAEQQKVVGLQSDDVVLSGASLNPQSYEQRLETELIKIAEKVTEFRNNQDFSSPAYAETRWHYAQIACALNKFSLAIDVYDEMIANPELRDLNGERYYGTALRRALTIHFNERNSFEETDENDAFSKLFNKTLGTGPDIIKSDKCCIMLLCAGHFAIKDKLDIAKQFVSTFEDSLKFLTQEEVSHVLDFSQGLLNTFGAFEISYHMRMDVYNALIPFLEASENFNARFHQQKYVELKLESIRLQISHGDFEEAEVALDRLSIVDEVLSNFSGNREIQGDWQLHLELAFLYGKIGRISGAEKHTDKAEELTAPTENQPFDVPDLIAAVELAGQQIHLLSLNRAPQRAVALANKQLLRIECFIGGNIRSVVEKQDHVKYAKLYEQEQKRGDGKQFLTLMDFYASFLYVRAILAVAPTKDREKLSRLRQMIEVIDGHSEQRLRVNNLIIEEAAILVGQENGDFAEMKSELRAVFENLKSGHFNWGFCGFLMAILTIRELHKAHQGGQEGDFDSRLLNEIESYLEAGEEAIRSQREKRRYIPLAKLLLHRANVCILTDDNEAAAGFIEEGMSALEEGNVQDCDLGLELSSSLVKLYGKLGDAEKQREAEERKARIEGALKRFLS